MSSLLGSKSWIDDLLDWFDPDARRMPWRQHRNPYRVWISETMLQQTQVATVIPYFERFMAQFPTVDALAGASLDEVLKLWEGLGYYSRARSLHRCANVLVERHEAALPPSYDALLELPGVGPYTAGAIASLAFGLPHPAIDGNVLRVTSRLWGVEDPVDVPRTREAISRRLQEVIPAADPGPFNEALMELGATVCLPRTPRCEGCPLALHCRARHLEAVTQFPVKSPRKKPRIAFFQVAVVTAPGPSYLVTRRPEGGLLGGLWEFPTIEIAGPEEKMDIPASSLGMPGLDVHRLEAWQVFDHAFTHIRGTYRIGTVRWLDVPPLVSSGWRWVSSEELENLALGKVHQRIRHDLLR